MGSVPLMCLLLAVFSLHFLCLQLFSPLECFQLSGIQINSALHIPKKGGPFTHMNKAEHVRPPFPPLAAEDSRPPAVASSVGTTSKVALEQRPTRSHVKFAVYSMLGKDSDVSLDGEYIFFHLSLCIFCSV